MRCESCEQQRRESPLGPVREFQSWTSLQIGPAKEWSRLAVAHEVKRYGPEWLGGTSIGEVMFQADYHLKDSLFHAISSSSIKCTASLRLRLRLRWPSRVASGDIAAL